MKEKVKQIYTQKNRFILIGLTGKTGSGCSTVAEILSKGYQEYKAVNEKDLYMQQKKDRIVKKFAEINFKDKNFYIIKPSTIIMMIFILEKSIFFKEIRELKKLIEDSNNNASQIKEKCQDILDIYDVFLEFNIESNVFVKDETFKDLLQNYKQENNNLIIEYINKKKIVYEERFIKDKKDNLKENIYQMFDLTIDIMSGKQNQLEELLDKYEDEKDVKNKYTLKREITDLIFEDIAKTHPDKFLSFYEKYNKEIKSKRDDGQLKIDTLQKIGDLVRSQIDIFKIPTYVNLIIKALRAKNKYENKECYIAIDSIKNPFEIVFFKERYSSFYTFSIHSANSNIYKRFEKENIDIKSIHKKEIINVDSEKQKESLSSIDDFNSQNIFECIQRSDIYIDNNLDKKDTLYKQIFKYLSLIVHPGLITPTKDEMIMQIALNAKFNSGCISRQVGAVVLNKYGSVKSIGWNDVPEGQVPCNLRSHNELLNNSRLSDYSEYEKNKLRKDNSFKIIFSTTNKNQYIESDNLGLPDSFCFKDIQNKKDKNKNQVYTRSLHAEENAFLQLAKYGNTQIIDGELFTTASPCFLCAKKAYQLGMKRVIYIEAYPDISNEQIFQCGFRETQMVHFRGAIGQAYHKLYEPLFSYKDELKALNS